MKQSLGIIEVKGFATAVSIADVLVKVAAVKLVDIEAAKGSGWMTIKILGDVGAVQAAVDAGAASARATNQLVSVKVIPRLAEGLLSFFMPSEDLKKTTEVIVEKTEEATTLIPEEMVDSGKDKNENVMDEKKSEKKAEIKQKQGKKNKKSEVKKDE